MKEPILEMKGICKSFSGRMVNDHVSLKLYSGEVHALLGENGAGKSTLMNILTGIYFPGAGEIYFNGRNVDIRSPRDAMDLGIGMVHQHFKLIGSLTVAENICLYLNQNRFWLSYSRINALVTEYSSRFGLPVDPSAKIDQLSVGQQQRVEILKLLISGARILILDEPTAVLTPIESERLLDALRKMAGDGKAVLFITHKMNEVLSAADRITVLRDGRVEACLSRGEASPSNLVSYMIGRKVSAPEKIDRAEPSDSVIARLCHVSTQGSYGRNTLHDVSLTIHEGEILGIAGISGNGQNALAETFAGLMKPASGEYYFLGRKLTSLNPKKAASLGIAYIPEDRMGTGLAGQMSLTDNYVMKRLGDSSINMHGVLNRRHADEVTQQAVDTFNIRTAGIHTRTSYMSGGNIQKLLVAREISLHPRLIIAEYPVHGLDVGAVDSIHRILLNEKARGTSILLISEDLDELLQMSDRIAVMCGGTVMDVLNAASATPEEIGSLMVGQAGGGEQYAQV